MESPLTELTVSDGAVAPPEDQRRPPIHYGNSRAEYEAALTGAVLRDCSHQGRILFRGSDHLDFLHRMSTNDFTSLTTGNGLQAVLTDNRGRILELGTFHHDGDQTLAIVSSGGGQRVPEWLDRFLFTESVEMADVTSDTAMVELLGPEASAVAGTVLGAPRSTANHHVLKTPGQDGVWMVRADRFGHEAVAIAGPARLLRAIWLDLRAAGISPIGEAAYDILRIEAGLPAPGMELNENHNPWEAGLAGAIHMDKGCYVGQEVLARLNTYEKVKQHLLGLRLPAAESVAASTPLVAGDNRNAGRKDAGSITSVCHSPRYGGIALAYVRTAYATAGTEVFCTLAENEVSATVTALPFR